MTQIKRDGRTGTWSATTDRTTHQAATLAALVAMLIATPDRGKPYADP